MVFDFIQQTANLLLILFVLRYLQQFLFNRDKNSQAGKALTYFIH